MTKKFSSLAAMVSVAAIALPGIAHADHCNFGTTVGIDVAVLNTGDGANHYLGECASSTESVSDTLTTSQMNISSGTTAGYGAMQATATVSSFATADKGVLASSGSSLGDGYVGRTWDRIYADTDTSFHFVTTYSFTGVASGTVTAQSTAWIQTLFFPSVGSSGDSEITLGGASGGTGSGTLSFDLFLTAGNYVSLRSSLGLTVDGSANWSGAVGDSSGTATYALGYEILNAGGSAHALSGHDYSIAAVPEPSSLAMLLAGLGLTGAIARRRKQ